MDAYVGEIRMFAGSYAPDGWLLCDGRTLSIAEYEVLFVLLGTTYGGDGQQSFVLPDLRGRTPIHQGQGRGLSPRALGQALGAEEVALTTQQLPLHTHAAKASTAAAAGASPNGKAWAATTTPAFHSGAPSNGLGVAMAPDAIQAAGGNLPHENRSPVVGVNFIICYSGIFPTRD